MTKPTPNSHPEGFAATSSALAEASRWVADCVIAKGFDLTKEEPDGVDPDTWQGLSSPHVLHINNVDDLIKLCEQLDIEHGYITTIYLNHGIDIDA